jgi:peptide/nickel transport system ATP-binding protein
MRERMGTSVILITHDLGVIAEMADRVAVMYAGRVVEEALVEELFDNQLHPYTQGLIASIPILGTVADRLDVIPGSVPNLINLPAGCRFAPRCRLREKYGLEICTREEPELTKVRKGHKVRCWLYINKGNHLAPIPVSEIVGS